MKKYFAVLFLVFISQFVFSQRAITKAATVPMFSFSYAFQIPQKDLALRFGANSNIGTAFTLKSENGWLIGLEAEYLFSGNIKEDSILDGLRTENGNIINKLGEYSNVLLWERGYFVAAKFGKIIPVFNINPNSGIYLSGSVGFLEHKIRIENQGNIAPQITGDYAKGYDRLTNGLAIKEFVGYMYIGENQLANFYAGFEFYQSWTQNRRSYNFDTMEADNSKRNDNLISFRLGWIIPLYRRIPDSYFTY